MNEIIEEEKKYLEYVKKVIELEINNSIRIENKLKKESNSLSFEDRLRGAHFNLNSELYRVGENVEKLQKSKNSPYFGRFDFKKENSSEVSAFYIGRVAIEHNMEQVVYDWRSPICSLYYDSEVGEVSYNSPSGIQNGHLLLKRQIIIKNGEIINTFDSNLASDDVLLLPYLNINADNKMKTIIASIQKEQNAIIRSDNSNIIVQGVAGSGKTSVALHRIAYLIYAMNGKNIEKNFLIIGPNNYFLNYISTILPDLETTPVAQTTFLNLLNDYLGTNLKLNDQKNDKNIDKQQMRENISTFKGSLEYRDLLDKFIIRCFESNEIVTDDFMLDGKIIFSSDQIRKSLLSYDKKHFNFTATRFKYKTVFKENKDDIYDRLNAEYRKMYTSLPFNDPLRRKYIEKSSNLRKLVYEQGDKLLDKYLKSLNKSCISLYVSFISDLDKEETSLTNEEMLLLQKQTLQNIKKKKIDFEDIAALIYLNYRLTSKKYDYKNIVIDEAQDYSLFAYYSLKQIFDNAKFNIYGDLAQSIYPYRSISSWEEVNSNVFDNNCKLLELSKSYRTTIEITNNANSILDWLNLPPANPVIRHGKNVTYVDLDKDNFFIIDKIYEWINSEYKTVAVICKDEDISKKVQEELFNNGIKTKYISNEDSQYDGGICVLSAASAKGLEFDCTIVYDASSNVYKANNYVDMHLLYVATTRALHEQVIVYNKELTRAFNNKIEKPKTLIKKND